MMMLLAGLLAAALQAEPPPVKDRDEGPCTVFAPATLSGKHPVILWGNGTQAPVVAYAGLLRFWASQGFIVAAAKTGMAGSGQDLLRCLDRLTERNSEAGGFYYGHVDLAHVGVSGHSQGGAGALMAARDPRVTASAPIQPASRGTDAVAAQHAPMLLLSGSADNTTPPERAQRPIFEAAKVPVVWATVKGATHFSPSSGDWQPFGQAALAFFKWRLMDDKGAARAFEGDPCGLCTNAQFSVVRK